MVHRLLVELHLVSYIYRYLFDGLVLEGRSLLFQGRGLRLLGRGQLVVVAQLTRLRSLWNKSSFACFDLAAARVVRAIYLKFCRCMARPVLN